MVTLPLHVLPTNDGLAPLKAPVNVQGQALTHCEWLQTLKRDHIVRVRKHNGETMPEAMVTNDSPCFVFVGKLKFRRSDGWQVKRQAKRCYRMKLRLVRNEREFT